VIVRYYAAARAAAGVSEERIDAPTLAAMRETLLARHDDRYAKVLAASALRRDGLTLLDDSLVLTDTDVVEVLPPFAGG
jgi:molybdopterin synthase sulfur carrier subunit